MSMLGPSIINMNENIDVGADIQALEQSHNMLVPQFRCFAIFIQRFVQFPNFIFAQLQLFW